MKTEEIPKRTYVSPVIEMIDVDNENLLDISATGKNQDNDPEGGGSAWKAKSSDNDFTYKRWDANFSDEEYEDGNEEMDDLDIILSRLQ